MGLLAGAAGKAGEHLGRVEPRLPLLKGNDHPALLGPVLLADAVFLEGDLGVVPSEGAHLISPRDRFPVRSRTVSLEPECKVKPLDLALGCRVYL
jgi:hypothetical protein